MRERPRRQAMFSNGWRQRFSREGLEGKWRDSRRNAVLNVPSAIIRIKKGTRGGRKGRVKLTMRELEVSQPAWVPLSMIPDRMYMLLATKRLESELAAS
jgi:hypothetical protein